MLVGQAIEKALIAEGYTDVSYTIEDGKIQKISAKNGSATVNFKYGDEISSNDVAYLGNGESIADAISDGAKTVYLTDGTFQMDAQVTGDLTIIGDDGTLVSVVDELVHSAGSEGGREDLADRVARVDIRDELTETL